MSLPSRRVTDLVFCHFFPTGPSVGITAMGSENIFVNRFPQSRFPAIDIAVHPTGLSIPSMGAIRAWSDPVTTHRFPEVVIGYRPRGIGFTISGSLNYYVGN